MTENRDQFVNRLFKTYSDLLGEFEPSPAFVAKVWAGIEARKQEKASWAFYLIAWAPRLAIASVALAALLTVSQWMLLGDSSESALLETSYVDVLALDSADEQDGALWVLAENGK